MSILESLNPRANLNEMKVANKILKFQPPFQKLFPKKERSSVSLTIPKIFLSSK